MPNLPTHLYIAQSALDKINDVSIRKYEAFYLLGATAPDIKALSKIPREQSHFVQVNSFTNIGDGPRLLLKQNPYIKSVSGMYKAFWAGYISHLILDETWIIKMYRTKFAHSIDKSNHDYLQIMDRAAQLHLDKIAYAHNHNWVKILDEIDVADAYPNGKKPFKRKDYINKFKILTSNIIDSEESDRFLNDVQDLRNIGKFELHKLNIKVKSEDQKGLISKKGIF